MLPIFSVASSSFQYQCAYIKCVPKIGNWQHSHGQYLQRFQRVRIKEERHNTIYPRFGSRAGSFLTQRRKGAEKTVLLCFLKVIFIFATPYKRHPIGEDSLCQKNSRIYHFPTELHFFSALKSTAFFRII